MGKKASKNQVRKRQQQAMRKRQKDNKRHKARSSTVIGENAVQHQMISTFGNVQNFVRTVQHLGAMFKTDADLSQLRLDADKVYEKIDLVQMRDALEDMYKDEDLTVYDETYEADWKELRKTVLEDLIDDDFVEKTRVTFEKLVLTKKGHKKEYRAALAGKLLLESHITSLKESPINENALWEIIFNAAIKENQKELPEKPAEEPEQAIEEAPAETPVEEEPASEE